jgi:DNA-binding transcriptional LysR family regulator
MKWDDRIDLDQRARTARTMTGKSSASHFDITSLRLFASVVEQANIAQAARANNIAASAVSKRISDLEARIGIGLLYRTRDGVEATPAGQALFRHVKRILRMLKNLDAELSEYTNGVRGQVRIWATTSAVTQFLPEDLAAYATGFPAVKIELREEASQVIIDAIRDGFADMGIFSGHITNAEIETRVYRRDTLMVIVPSGHPLAQREKVRLAETAEYDHVGLPEGSSLQWKLMKEAEAQGIRLHFRVNVLSFDGIRRMVEAGLGLAVLPEGAVTPYLGTGKLSAIALDEPWAMRSLLLGYRDYRSLPVVARALVEYLAPAPHGSEEKVSPSSADVVQLHKSPIGMRGASR